MGSGRVFIAVEDVYAVDAIRDLLRRKSFEISRVIVKHLQPCSGKMRRIVHAHRVQGTHVIIVVDAESNLAKDRERWLRETHRLDRDVEVVVFDPCIEAAPCIALGLSNCRVKPCSQGPLKSVNEYWRRTRNRDYEKRFLTLLLREADAKGRLDSVPEIAQLLEAVREALKDP